MMSMAISSETSMEPIRRLMSWLTVFCIRGRDSFEDDSVDYGCVYVNDA